MSMYAHKVLTSQVRGGVNAVGGASLQVYGGCVLQLSHRVLKLRDTERSFYHCQRGNNTGKWAGY